MAGDIVAVACVVESSLALAAEWRDIMTRYVVPLIQRLVETHGTSSPHPWIRMGFVTYATADTEPTPVLAKRFFTDFQNITKEMREEHGKLGIGHTASGGVHGMSALEGLVAGIELFDDLCDSLPTDGDGKHVFHIIHVAASPPDASHHPLWNMSTLLDDVTWDTLPSEMRKRNINYSSVNLRSVPRFTDLHSATAAGSVQLPWFQIHPQHNILLAGFPSPQKGTKRPGEPSTGDAKRPRMSQPSVETSPKGSNNSSPTHRPNSAQPPTKLTSQPQMSLPTAAPSPLQDRSVLARIRSAEASLIALKNRILQAQAAGNLQQVESLKSEFARQNAAHVKFKAALTEYMQNHPGAKLQTAQARGAGLVQIKDEFANTNAQAMSSTQMQTAPLHSQNEVIPPTFGSSAAIDNNAHMFTPPNSNPNHGPDPQALAQLLQHKRSMSGGFAQMPNSNSNMNANGSGAHVSPNVVLQMQKLLEQRQQQQRNTQLAGGLNMGMPIRTAPDTVSNEGKAVKVWDGVLTWKGYDDKGPKEVRVHVTANTNVQDCRADTWPTTLTLTPTPERGVPLDAFQAWLKRTRPIVCTFTVSSGFETPAANDSHYQSLIQLLTAKNIYAVAAWTLPSGVQKNNVLIFPHTFSHGVVLLGAFFPITGIPEMPKASMPSTPSLPPGANSLARLNLPPHFITHLQKMTPDDRNRVLQQMMTQRQRQQQQNHPPHPSGSGLPFNQPNESQGVAYPNNAILGMLANQTGGGVGPNLNNMDALNLGFGPHGVVNAGLPRSLPGGVGNGVSYAMLQNFMQRNQEGGGEAGPG